MSAQEMSKLNGLVAVNSLVAMVGGTLAALIAGKNDPGFVHNGPLAGLVAVCAGSDVMHPGGAFVVGAVAGALFVYLFTHTQNRWKIDDVLACGHCTACAEPEAVLRAAYSDQRRLAGSVVSRSCRRSSAHSRE